MKKISNIKELKAQQEKLQQRQAELEEKIQADWEELKLSLRPLNLARKACNYGIEQRLQQQLKNDSIWKNTLTYSAALLGKRIADKAKEKWDMIFAKR